MPAQHLILRRVEHIAPGGRRRLHPPKKLRPDSEMIVAPTSSVAATIIGVDVLGSTPKNMRVFLMPKARRFDESLFLQTENCHTTRATLVTIGMPDQNNAAGSAIGARPRQVKSMSSDMIISIKMAARR